MQNSIEIWRRRDRINLNFKIPKKRIGDIVESITNLEQQISQIQYFNYPPEMT